ncbi:MAG: FlgD immunoglobulin-like domain containing protein, partial [Rhodothermales bacterium]
YNPLGERVRLLARGPMPAGTHRVTWNGNGVDGSRVGAGFYLVRLTDGTRQRILKVVKVL